MEIGKFYIRNLMLIIIFGTALVYGFTLLSGDNTLINNIELVPSRVMEGEVWRLVTFIFVPTSSGIISFMFSMYFYYL